MLDAPCATFQNSIETNGIKAHHIYDIISEGHPGVSSFFLRAYVWKESECQEATRGIKEARDTSQL